MQPFSIKHLVYFQPYRKIYIIATSMWTFFFTLHVQSCTNLSRQDTSQRLLENHVVVPLQDHICLSDLVYIGATSWFDREL